MFVAKEEVAVTLDNENFIFIKAKFNFGEKKRLQSALLSGELSKNNEVRMAMDWGASQVALLTLGITKWSGPAFAGRECNEANILQLDEDDPLVEKVLAEIGKRNNKGEKTDPKADSGDGNALLTVMQAQ